MSAVGDIEWARRLRAQLAVDIQILSARAREGGGHPEVLGLLPDGDRLSELHRRLEQVDRLILAIEDAEHTDWPAHLADPPQPETSPGQTKR